MRERPISFSGDICTFCALALEALSRISLCAYICMCVCLCIDMFASVLFDPEGNPETWSTIIHLGSGRVWG